MLLSESPHYQSMIDSLRYLASVCDGAHEEDGVGFNGVDTRFGKSLAQQSYQNKLSDKQVVNTLELLQKYRGQIKSAAIELPNIADFEIATDIQIKLQDDLLYIYLPQHLSKKGFREIVDKIKSIYGRIWIPTLNGKPWSVPVNQIDKLKELFPDAIYNFDSDSIDVKKPEPTKHEPSKIKKHDDGYHVVLAKDDSQFQDKLNVLRALPNRKWENGYWLISDIGSIALLLSQFEIETDTMTGIDLVLYNEISNRQVAPDDFKIPGVNGTPYPFQIDGVYLVEKANGCLIIGDDMGLGKTLQFLMYLQLYPELRPAIIVVPATLKTHWYRQHRQWLQSEDRIEILSGQKAKFLPDADVYIVNYDILSYWLPLLKQVKPKIIGADEAHYLKNKTTNRTKAFDSLAKQCQSVLLLTGTAVQNRPAELWKLLNLVNPKAWSNWFNFAHRYCDAKKIPVRYRDKRTGKMVRREVWDFNGASNLSELHERIKPYFIRRLKKDVLTLGEKSRITVPLDVPDAKLKAYKMAMKVAMDKLIQDGKEDAMQLVMFEKAKQAAFEAKFDAVVEWVSSLLESGRKLVLFVIHKEAARRLKDTFSGVSVVITGETLGKNRSLAVDRFQHDSNVRLLIGNIQAAGVGLTLTAASDVAFVEFDWTPANHTQAEDRVYRIGQDAESVQAWYLVLPETIEETIVELLYRKSVTVSAILDGTTDEVESTNIFSEFLSILKQGD